MNYYIGRGGEQYGPYSLQDLQRYFSQGSIVATDMARREDSPTWVSVTQILGGAAPFLPSPPPIQPGMDVAPQVTPSGVLAPLPPNLHWALVLLFSVLTCSLFAVVWAFVQATWVKKLVPRTNAVLMYALYVLLLFLATAISIAGAAANPPAMGPALVSPALNLAALVCFYVGAFNIRSCLREYYNSVEPIGLRLSGVMTFFFNTLYFQYHMSRIHHWKKTGVLTPQG